MVCSMFHCDCFCEDSEIRTLSVAKFQPKLRSSGCDSDSASCGLYAGLTAAKLEFENARSLLNVMPKVPLVSADTLLSPKSQSYSLLVNARLPATWKGELTGTTLLMISPSAVAAGSKAPLATSTASWVASGSSSATVTLGLFISP